MQGRNRNEQLVPAVFSGVPPSAAPVSNRAEPMKVFVVTFLIPLVVLTGGVYLLFCAALYVQQERLLYYPNLPGRELQHTPADIGLAYEEVAITAADGVRLHGWYLPAERERGVLLFLHGNAGNISHRLDSLRIFHDLGMTVLIFDYRGYGQSQGKISEHGTALDGEAAWGYLTTARGVAPERIIVFGRSLGGAVAARLAASHPPGGLILESVFTSVPDLAAELYPLFPVRLLNRYQYNALAALERIGCPVLVIHSPDDDIIPFRHGQRLFAAAREPKTFLQLRGDHNRGFLESGDIYRQGLAGFIASVVKPGPGSLH